MSHTPEPWTEKTIVRFEDMPRVRACVNGCAGLNPAAYREVVEALKILIDRQVQRNSNAVHPSQMFCHTCGSNSKKTVHAKGCPVEVAEQALARAQGSA